MIPETSQTDDRDDALLVETSGLTKRYGASIMAVDDLDRASGAARCTASSDPTARGKLRRSGCYSA